MGKVIYPLRDQADTIVGGMTSWVNIINGGDTIDTKELDKVKDELVNKINSIQLTSTKDMTYDLTIEGKNVGQIQIPKDQFLKEVNFNKTTNKLEFEFETKSGAAHTDIDLASLVDTYTGDNGIVIENKTIKLSFNIDDYATAQSVSDLTEYVGETDKAVEALGARVENLVIPQNVSDLQDAQNYLTTNDIDKRLQNKANQSDFDSLEEQVQTINSYVGSLPTSIGEFSDALDYAKKIDVPIVPTNVSEFNNDANYAVRDELPANVSQLANDNGFVTLDDIEESNKFSSKKDVQYILGRIVDITECVALEQKLNTMNSVFNNLVTMNLSAKVDGPVNDPTIMAVVNNNVESAREDKTETYVAKSITFAGVEIKETRLNLKAENVSFFNTTIANGTPKSLGNANIMINDAETVVFKNMQFNADTCYNGIEIGLNSENLPSKVIFDGCTFMGKFTNNPISIFGTKDKAEISLVNCEFQNVSNALRISNKTNAVDVVINITNCKCSKWESSANYSGLILFQDYTSKGKEAETNLFNPGKITVNVCSFKGPDGFLIGQWDNEKNLGSQEQNKQFAYVYNDTEGVLPYGDGLRYPTFKIYDPQTKEIPTTLF